MVLYAAAAGIAQEENPATK